MVNRNDALLSPCRSLPAERKEVNSKIETPSHSSRSQATGMVSVAMCTFNGENYLREQVDSILAQSRRVDEIVVADDGSTDGTRKILTEYSEKNPGLFKLFFHQNNVGTIENFGFALAKTRGEIIFFCDQDDIWSEQKVEVMVKNIESSRCLLLFTNGRLVDSSGKPLGYSLFERFRFSAARQILWRFFSIFALYDLMNNNNKVTGATVAIHRSLLDRALPIQLLPDGYWHDVWFAIHAAANAGIAFLPQSLIDYRIHPKQQVGIKAEIGSHNRSTVSIPELFASMSKLYPRQARQVERIRGMRSLRAKFKFRAI